MGSQWRKNLYDLMKAHFKELYSYLKEGPKCRVLDSALDLHKFTLLMQTTKEYLYILYYLIKYGSTFITYKKVLFFINVAIEFSMRELSIPGQSKDPDESYYSKSQRYDFNKAKRFEQSEQLNLESILTQGVQGEDEGEGLPTRRVAI